MSNESEKSYVVYDGRANYDPDEAAVLGTSESLEGAKSIKEDYEDAVIYQYDRVGDSLKNGEMVLDDE